MKTPLLREHWKCLLDLVQHMWRTGETHRELVWTIMILIPKETTDTRGIGLLETLWKVVEALIENRLCSSLQMHDVLHGFRDGRRTGTAIMELKIAQEISSIDQDPLLLLLLDLRKAYGTVNQDCLLITLEGYGEGTWMCGLLETLWEYEQVVLRQNGFHGPAFPATRGTMQGGLMYLTLFNMVVDNVIRTWMEMTVEDQRVAHDGLVETV